MVTKRGVSANCDAQKVEATNQNAQRNVSLMNGAAWGLSQITK